MSLKRILKSAIGVLLLPVVAGFSLAFYKEFGNISVVFTKGQQFFLWGILAYCLTQLLVFKPVLLYVLGHETVHALATWLCLGKVTSFNVTSAGGSITTSKSNFFISLSPYFVPIYSILWVVIYHVLNNYFIVRMIDPRYFMFGLGLTLAFHLVMTVDIMKTRQPDFLKVGYITSLALVYIINLCIIAGLIDAFFTGFGFRSFITSAYTQSAEIYQGIYNQIF